MIAPFCRGASEEAIRQSDIRCCIPMAGMVESFNISVAAGILMHHATRDRITRSVRLRPYYGFDIPHRVGLSSDTHLM